MSHYWEAHAYFCLGVNETAEGHCYVRDDGSPDEQIKGRVGEKFVGGAVELVLRASEWKRVFGRLMCLQFQNLQVQFSTDNNFAARATQLAQWQILPSSYNV